MAWTLTIRHLDVGNGDATLITAEDGSNRSHVLVDTGKVHYLSVLDRELSQAGVPRDGLDALVLTHYDIDHYGGAEALLALAESKNGRHMFNRTRVYDQGNPSDSHRNETLALSRYMNIVTRVSKSKDVGLTRKTDKVNSFDTFAPQRRNQRGVEMPWYLIGKEIFWDGRPPNANAPTMTCVAANRYLKNSTGAPRLATEIGYGMEDDDDVYSGRLNNDDNPKSLAFLIKLGNFRYYMGGDLESEQENALVSELAPGVGDVSALKCSHHGSDTATSEDFVKTFRPRMGVISSGTNAHDKNPKADTIVNLVQHGGAWRVFMTGGFNAQEFQNSKWVNVGGMVRRPLQNAERWIKTPGQGKITLTVEEQYNRFVFWWLEDGFNKAFSSRIN